MIRVLAPLGVVVALAALCGAFTPFGPTEIVGTAFAPPGGEHVLGTDELGRDVLSRVMAGGGELVTVSLLAALSATAIGVAGGLFTGWSDHWAARLVTSSADVLLAAPLLLVALVLAVALPGPAAVVAATVCGGAPLTLRVVRDATRTSRAAGYVEAARCRGEHGAALLVREVLPSVGGLVAADAGMRFVAAMQLAAALSLLGFGAQPPHADWALMIRENLPGSGLNAAGVLAPATALAAVTAIVAAAAAFAGRRVAPGGPS